MNRSCVLIFSGLDPSGGAGIQADIEAINNLGSHALPIITTLTAQDNDKVFDIFPVSHKIISQQAEVLIKKINISAVKIGITGSFDNVDVIINIIKKLKLLRSNIPIILDPVLSSGNNNSLSKENIPKMIFPIQNLATLITPNLIEVEKLYGENYITRFKNDFFKKNINFLVKGGHSNEKIVRNFWYSRIKTKEWKWPRLSGNFHGSGCTLASAVSALLAQNFKMEDALEKAQNYVQNCLENSYSISNGQIIPHRNSIKLRDFK